MNSGNIFISVSNCWQIVNPVVSAMLPLCGPFFLVSWVRLPYLSWNNYFIPIEHNGDLKTLRETKRWRKLRLYWKWKSIANKHFLWCYSPLAFGDFMISYKYPINNYKSSHYRSRCLLYMFIDIFKKEWEQNKQTNKKTEEAVEDVALVSKSFMDKNCLKKNVSCLFQPECVKEGHRCFRFEVGSRLFLKN